MNHGCSDIVLEVIPTPKSNSDDVTMRSPHGLHSGELGKRENPSFVPLRKNPPCFLMLTTSAGRSGLVRVHSLLRPSARLHTLALRVAPLRPGIPRILQVAHNESPTANWWLNTCMATRGHGQQLVQRSIHICKVCLARAS